MTPAQAAGVEASPWTVPEPVERCREKQKYIERVVPALEHLHNCPAIHQETVPVHEVFQRKADRELRCSTSQAIRSEAAGARVG